MSFSATLKKWYGSNGEGEMVVGRRLGEDEEISN